MQASSIHSALEADRIPDLLLRQGNSPLEKVEGDRRGLPAPGPRPPSGLISLGHWAL